MRYEVTGIPLGPSEVAGQRVGDLVDLDLTDEAEAALIGAGAIKLQGGDVPAEPETEPPAPSEGGLTEPDPDPEGPEDPEAGNGTDEPSA
jgi:hypothetical protein